MKVHQSFNKIKLKSWRNGGSNSRLFACKANTLPLSYTPDNFTNCKLRKIRIHFVLVISSCHYSRVSGFISVIQKCDKKMDFPFSSHVQFYLIDFRSTSATADFPHYNAPINCRIFRGIQLNSHHIFTKIFHIKHFMVSWVDRFCINAEVKLSSEFCSLCCSVRVLCVTTRSAQRLAIK